MITTHSASLIRCQRDVILLEDTGQGNIDVIYHCPLARAIGAIGMREDTMPDIVVLVEDDMARALFTELRSRYQILDPDSTALDIRTLEIGGFQNVIKFYKEARGYIFYNNVHVTAFMDKDVETDIIAFPQYEDDEYIQYYRDNSKHLRFLPDTPEVLLMRTLVNHKHDLLRSLRMEYSCQQLDYNTCHMDFTEYDSGMAAGMMNQLR